MVPWARRVRRGSGSEPPALRGGAAPAGGAGARAHTPDAGTAAAGGGHSTSVPRALLSRGEARTRAERLRTFAGDAPVVPILIHREPDPDAVASALGIRKLLERDEERAPIVTLGGATRPENRRMMALLHLRVTEVSEEELYRFDRAIAVDTQPRELDLARLGRLAVVDHHPGNGHDHFELADIRPWLAACATIVTEYLRAYDARRIGRGLATALLYGIKTDSDNLTRSVTPADVRAYAFLQTRAQLDVVRRIERPMYSVALMRSYGRALASVAVDKAVAAAFAGTLSESDSHILAELADLCLAVEGVCWAVVGGVVGDDVVLSIRRLTADTAETDGGAGALAERLAGEEGRGGGHATMARATWPRTAADQRLFAESLEEAAARLLRRVQRELEAVRGTPPTSPRPES